MGLKSNDFVTIVMPSLNEEKGIAAAMLSVLPPSDCGFDLELIVVDGGSEDATRSIVNFLARADGRIRLIHNPSRTQAAGVNLAARVADPRSTILVRADCHAKYPSSFVSTCASRLRETGAASVVVPMQTVGASCMERAISAAQNSTMGNGGSAHRRPSGVSEHVAHGHHAAFDRGVYLALGGYDETFVANEDAEYDTRVIASGRSIWMAREATIVYHPRSTLYALGRQYFRNGIGRVSTSLKCGARLEARQMVPIVAMLSCLGSLLLSVFDYRFGSLLGVYVASVSAWASVLAFRIRRPCILLSAAAAMTMHMAFALGAVWALSQARRGQTGRLEGLGTSGGAA